jgi:hypothetical protein
MHQLLKTVASVQLGPNRRKSNRFLLGFWRDEDLD